MRLPDFIAVGPVRTGTTWLDSIFRGRIGLPARIKELQFFGWRYELGLDWYARHFRHCHEAVVGEFGPTYFFDKEPRERIEKHIPHCKIVITLREPVERIYSHYKLLRKLGMAKGAFAQEITTNPYLSSRLTYTPQVRAWKDHFGEENTLVLIHEESKTNPQDYIDRLCDFVGTPRFSLDMVAHAGRQVAHFERAPRSLRYARRARRLQYYLEVTGHLRLRVLLEPVFEWCMTGGDLFPALDPEIEARLRRECAPDVAALAELLGRDLSIWRQQTVESTAAALEKKAWRKAV